MSVHQQLQKRQLGSFGSVSRGVVPEAFAHCLAGHTGLARRLQCTAELPARGGPIQALAWSSDGNLLLSGGDWQVQLWAFSPGEQCASISVVSCLQKFKQAPCFGCELSAGQSVIVSQASAQKTESLCRFPTLTYPSFQSSESIFQRFLCRAAPTASAAVFLGRSSGSFLSSLLSLRSYVPVQGHTRDICELAFVPDTSNSQFISCSADSQVILAS